MTCKRSSRQADDCTRRHAVVLGGSGFIGRHVVHDLIDNGWRVTVASRHAAIEHHPGAPTECLRCVSVDLAETNRLSALLDSASVFIHLAHNTVPSESMADLTRDLNGSLLPTVRLLSCLPSSCKRVVFVSSGGTVYGQPLRVPLSEDHPTEPRSAYGVAKLALEKYVQICCELAGVSSAIVRPSNVYGAGQRIDRMQGAVAVFLARILQGQRIELWGDGLTVRDYVYVTEVARAIRLLAEKDQSGVWNVGSSRATSLNDLIALLERTTGQRACVSYAPARGYDVRANVLDCTRLWKAVGWRPMMSLEQGVRLQYASLRSKAGDLARHGQADRQLSPR